MYKFATIILLLLIFATLASAEQKAATTELKTPKFIGHAYDIETQELLYTEHHNYLNTLLHEVEYKEVNGEIFATKSINYKHSYFAPDFTQHNKRNGEKINIKRKSEGNDETKIAYQIQYQESSKQTLKKETINYSSRLIIDAGFDHFITHNWQALSAGKEMTIDYLIPSLQDYYELTIKQETCKSKSQGQYCFSISASSFFIGLFSSQLELSYNKIKDSEDNETVHIQLMGFQGRSNISDSKGNYQDVNIIYQY